VIFVDRKAVPAPADLDGETSEGARERQRVIDFYRDPANRELMCPIAFKAYKLPGVIKALEQLFKKKCSYCETFYAATQPVDVEHFRPKSGVAVVDAVTGKPRLQRPGYYWLAANWENLLPSCIDCNRERTQEIPGEDPAKVGKANKFPIANRRYRFEPDALGQETPLLLNPCVDRPEEHLEFLDDGVIRPALDARRRASRKGKASIQVYGLRRAGLVQARRDYALQVRAQIERVQKLEGILDLNVPQQCQMLEYEMATLKGYMESSRPYAQMARQLIRRNYRPAGQALAP
jgi:uncharacterized protein (TIGR02646 family)